MKKYYIFEIYWAGEIKIWLSNKIGLYMLKSVTIQNHWYLLCFLCFVHFFPNVGYTSDLWHRTDRVSQSWNKFAYSYTPTLHNIHPNYTHTPRHFTILIHPNTSQYSHTQHFTILIHPTLHFQNIQIQNATPTNYLLSFSKYNAT